MKEPTKKELLDELRRLKAENERLGRLVATQRPELQQLRRVEIGLRDYLNNGARNLERIHAECLAMLPDHDDDLFSLDEIRGVLGKGKVRVDAALAKET